MKFSYKQTFSFVITSMLLLILLSNSAFARNKKLVSSSASFASRQSQEEKAGDLSYTFIAHKPSYIMPLTYSFKPNPDGNGSLGRVDNAEVKFQFSFKINLIEEFFDHFRLSFGYTNLSFWQLYNKQDSAAFREANHEPEVFLVFNPSTWSSGQMGTIYRLGFVHQSNGQDVERSRSWNRLYAQVVHDLTFVVADLKVWHRVHEKAKENPDDGEGDDNPDITDFLGNFELRLTSKIYANTWSVLWRNNLKSPNKGAVDVTFSTPIRKNLKLYIQYFNGYGESLIDYNYSIERVGLGVVIADWL